MNEILIETLTPVHIGNGRVLLRGMEYIPFSSEGLFAVLDDRKVLATIGAGNLNKWVSAINTGNSIFDLLKAMRSGLQPSDVALRTIKSRTMTDQANGIREQINSIKQQPVIPGSSLKGSLRTAWFSEEVKKKGKLSESDLGFKLSNGKFKFSDSSNKFFDGIQNVLLGSSPNKDIFRLLRLDDYTFSDTECLLAETLNQRGKAWDMKDGVVQYIECIPQGAYSRGRLQEAGDLKKIIKQKGRPDKDHLPGMENFSVEELLRRANAQTLTILNKELKLWEERESRLPKGAANFIEELRRLKEEAEKCRKAAGCAVVRLGFGSGHDSLTGGWQSECLSEELQNKVANAVRGNPKYEGLEFPKSRRMVNGGTPLGFIKITLSDSRELDAIMTAKQAKATAEREAREREARETREAALKQQEEARKPVEFNGKIKQGIKLEGEIIRVENGLGIGQFVVNGETVEALVRSLSNPDVGAIITVTVPQLSGGKIKEVKWMSFKK